MAKKVYEEAHIKAIADKMREKTGGDATYKTSEMPLGIESVYEAGKKSMVDESKIIEATVTGKERISLSDVSEIPHKITAFCTALRENTTFTSPEVYYDNGYSPVDKKVPMSITGTGEINGDNYIVAEYMCCYEDDDGNRYEFLTTCTIYLPEDFDYAILNGATGIIVPKDGTNVECTLTYPKITDLTLTVTDNGTNTATYKPNENGIVENITSYSPNMTFSIDNEGIDITVNYHKSWGIQTGYNRIFERIQDGGNPQNYYYAFAYNRFDDTNFFPIGPIKCSDGNTPGQYMFYNATGLTDTKVEIVANSNNINYAFQKSGLVTIRKLTVYESTAFSNSFSGCRDLINILFGGTIGKAISFKDSSELSDESVDSIIEHLKDLTGATAQTLTVHTTVYNKIVSSGKDALITAKNWSLAKG